MYSALFDVNFIVLGRVLFEISQKHEKIAKARGGVYQIRNQRPNLH